MTSGHGITTALLEIDPFQPGSGGSQPYDYGTFGAPTDHTFTVVNTGAQAATSLADAGTLGAEFIYKDGAYPGTGGTCTTSLAAGGQCQLVVTFVPSVGPRGSTLTLGYNDGVNASAQAAEGLQGTAVSGPLLRIDDWSGGNPGGPNNMQPPFDYGTWGTHVYHTFTVSNVGSAGRQHRRRRHARRLLLLRASALPGPRRQLRDVARVGRDVHDQRPLLTLGRGPQLGKSRSPTPTAPRSCRRPSSAKYAGHGDAGRARPD